MTIDDLKYRVDEARDELLLEIAVALQTGKSSSDLKQAALGFERARVQLAAALREQ